MPAPLELRLEAVGDDVVVSYGGRAVASYERGDRGMRNLAIVALTRAGVSCVEAGRVFGKRPEHVSRLRRQVSEGGSAALLPRVGRPPKLAREAVARVYEMSDRGVTGAGIADALGVSAATISRLLARQPRRDVECLSLADTDPADAGDAGSAVATEVGDPVVADRATAAAAVVEDGPVVGDGPVVVDGPGLARIVEGGGRSVYAGSMLLHAFFCRVGAGAVFAALDAGAGSCYDATALALAATFAFALGSSSLEGSKHLLPGDAGLLVGVERLPHLRTLRPRLGELADSTDPLALQVALAKAMLDADPVPPGVFFVDDHFVAYTGSRPVAKGWNTRRRHAEAGRNETVVVDDRWRAVCFASGAPQGLARAMRSPLDQLQEICGERAVMIGFDRGGSYPAVFRDLDERGMHWVTYRRAPLATPLVQPSASWVTRAGRRHYVRVADELLDLDGYGLARQISLYEHDRVALQILTSDLSTSAALLAHVLRCRWCVENTFKYLEQHHGLHWLTDYQMDIAPDNTLVRNPDRTQALAHLRTSETRVAELEREIGKRLTTDTTPTTTHATTTTLADRPDRPELPSELRDDLTRAHDQVLTARAALKPIPAKVPATNVNPDAQRATPRTNRRAFQTVCRLLAYNAELDLARALNTYLADPDEYRAITRHLLHQPGDIHYTPTNITVTLSQPHAPRIARALNLLIDQINNDPPKLPGDNRPITYRTATP